MTDSRPYFGSRRLRDHPFDDLVLQHEMQIRAPGRHGGNVEQEGGNIVREVAYDSQGHGQRRKAKRSHRLGALSGGRLGTVHAGGRLRSPVELDT